MRPPTKINRIRFTDEETIGLVTLAKKMGVPRAAIVRAFVRLGLGSTHSKLALHELATLVRADAVKRGRELGYAKADREKGSVAA